MGTLAELKARILDECPGVTPRLIGQHVARAIENFAAERFWFSQASGTAVTVASTATVAFPTSLRRDDRVMITIASGQPYELQRQSYPDMAVQLAEDTSQGQPQNYAVNDGSILLYPTPAGIYTVTVVGLFDEATLSSDASTNAWTTEAVSLIAARAKKTLYRDVLHNPDGANAAAAAEDEELYRLRSETTQRGAYGRLKAG